MPTDVTPIDTVTLPLTCLACGADGARPGGTCTRCGLTDEDTRALLLSASRAYTSARADAAAGRYDVARGALSEAGALGLAGHPAVERLRALCDAADAPAADEVTAGRYAQARAAAHAGRFGMALQLDPPDAAGTPAVRELIRLSRIGAGLRSGIQMRQTALTAAVFVVIGGMGWRLFVTSSQVPQPVESPAASVVSIAPSPLAIVSPSPSPSASPASKQFGTIFAKEYPYPERLARRYYNDALAARRNHDYPAAARLAEAAAATGKNTYIQPNALLLRAEIADTIRETGTATRWASIAASAPDSPYAPLGLLRAAERARDLTKDDQAARPYLLELIHRYGTSNEAAIARRRFGPIRE